MCFGDWGEGQFGLMWSISERCAAFEPRIRIGKLAFAKTHRKGLRPKGLSYKLAAKIAG